MPFKNGDTLQQRVFVAMGDVVDVRYDATSGKFEYLLSYIDEAGNDQQRWFDETQVEAV